MEIRGKAFLAPLAEFTTFSFRELCRMHSADYTLVPLISAAALARNPEKRVDIGEDEKTGVQLFGSRPEDFRHAIKTLEERFPKILWFDLNCGCPSPRLRGVKAGSALLEMPGKATEIVKAMKAASGLPVSAKIRLTGKTADFCRAIERAGTDFVIVHGKTYREKHSANADWDYIWRLRESLSIPIVGNGGITSAAHGMDIVEQGKADGFMIGRNALRNPLIFENRKPKNAGSMLSLFMEYARIAEERGREGIAAKRLIAAQMFRNFRGSVALRRRISTAKTPEELLSTLKSFSLKNNQR